MTLPAATKRLRQHLDLRQFEFAERLGISLQSVFRYEQGRMPPAAVLSRLYSLATEQGETDLAAVFAQHGGSDEQGRDKRPNFAEMALPHIDGDLALVLMSLAKSIFDPAISSENERKDIVGAVIARVMNTREFIKATQSRIAGVE